MHKLLLALQILFIAPILFIAVACSNNNAAPNGSGGASPGSASADALSGSGDDMYYEYKITSAGRGISMNGYQKLYVSSGGGLRSEMDMSNPAAIKSAPIVSIGNKEKPNQSTMIDDSAKTYTVNIIDTSSASSNDLLKLSSTVTKLEEEKVLGFNCKHVRVISTRSMGPMGKFSDTVELWNSPDVPMAPFFRNYMDKSLSKAWTSMISPDAANQLTQMGFSGFMVRIRSGSGVPYGMLMELTKVQKGDFPKSMFEIPAGYKEEKQ
jgi:Domain of unknown function (DUF4412)